MYLDFRSQITVWLCWIDLSSMLIQSSHTVFSCLRYENWMFCISLGYSCFVSYTLKIGRWNFNVKAGRTNIKFLHAWHLASIFPSQISRWKKRLGRFPESLKYVRYLAKKIQYNISSAFLSCWYKWPCKYSWALLIRWLFDQGNCNTISTAVYPDNCHAC